MKKILFIASLFCLAIAGNAQNKPSYLNPERVVQSPRNLTNTDTLTLPAYGIGSNVKGFQISVLKVSGTVAGTVYLQATIDGIAWANIDSLVLSNVATVQTKITIPAHTSYNSYKAYFVSSGTQVYTPYFAYLRRPDENY